MLVDLSPVALLDYNQGEGHQIEYYVHYQQQNLKDIC